MTRKKKQERNPNKEYLDPTPIEIPVGFHVSESLRDSIKRMVQQEFSEAAHNSEMETFEEADDFEMEESDEFLTPYSVLDMEEEAIGEKEDLGEKASQDDEAEPRTVVDPDKPNTQGEDNKQTSPEQEATA